MKAKYAAIVVTLSLVLALPQGVKAQFPDKPIKLIVYTKTGGAIDIFARKFVFIASGYTDAKFEIVNHPGGGGLTALKEVIASNADGYKLMAVTKSNIGKIISTGGEIDTNQFSWLTMMVTDPEAVIVNARSDLNSWDRLLADAKVKNGEQVWVGPARGGNDHIMAMKIWDAAGIRAKWIPYASGGKALAALNENHAAAYVGNPQDVLGRPNLKIAVVAGTDRLEGQFSGVPTFKENGISGLDHEIMWRGFMVRKGSPKEALDFYRALFDKVNGDPEWQAFIKMGGANPVFYGEKDFTEIVNEDKVIFSETLKTLGLTK